MIREDGFGFLILITLWYTWLGRGILVFEFKGLFGVNSGKINVCEAYNDLLNTNSDELSFFAFFNEEIVGSANLIDFVLCFLLGSPGVVAFDV